MSNDDDGMEELERLLAEAQAAWKAKAHEDDWEFPEEALAEDRAPDTAPEAPVSTALLIIDGEPIADAPPLEAAPDTQTATPVPPEAHAAAAPAPEAALPLKAVTPPEASAEAVPEVPCVSAVVPPEEGVPSKAHAAAMPEEPPASEAVVPEVPPEAQAPAPVVGELALEPAPEAAGCAGATARTQAKAEEVDADALAMDVAVRMAALNQDLSLVADVFLELEPSQRVMLLKQLRYASKMVAYLEGLE